MLNSFIRQFGHTVRGLLEDHHCLICHEPVEDGLIRQFFRLPDRVGGACRSQGDALGRELRDLLCSRCASQLPLCFENWKLLKPGRIPVATVFRYEGGVRQAILSLKFAGETVLERFFALMAEYRLRRLHFRPAAVLPLPLGPKRLRIRGYNQAERIARKLCERMELPLRTDLLYRREETRPQTEMRSRRERQANVAGAFALYDRAGSGLSRDRELLLLDDVMTSGATVREAARPLLEAGYRVRVLCMAREELRVPVNEGRTGDSPACDGALF